MDKITTRLETDPRLQLTYRRIQVISDMVKSSDTKRNLTPQMSDLHQLSEQAILSHWMPTCLRITTSTLLICGICGTLWGVHEVIQNEGLSSDLSKFAKALEPSKWAVLATIFLTLFRGLYTAAVDRFLWRLDRETMIHFLPDLIPSSELGAQATKLADAINSFNENVGKSMNPIEAASKDISSKAHMVFDIVAQLSKTEDKLNGLLDQFTKTCQNVTAEQETIKHGLESAKSGLQTLSTGLDATKLLNITLRERIKTFQSNLQQIGNSLATNCASLNNSASKAQSLATQANALQQELGSLGSVNQEAQSLNTAIAEAVTANKNAYSFFSAKVKEASNAINGSKDTIKSLADYTYSLGINAQSAAVACQNAIQGAQEVRSYAENFQTNIYSRDEEISTVRRSMENSHKELDAESEKIQKSLQQILSAAKKLEDNLPRTDGGTIMHRIKRIFEKLFNR